MEGNLQFKGSGERISKQGLQDKTHLQERAGREGVTDIHFLCLNVLGRERAKTYHRVCCSEMNNWFSHVQYSVFSHGFTLLKERKQINKSI